MEIKVFVKDGFLSFECEGVLPEPPREIVFDKQTRVFTLHFRKPGQQVEFDCPMDEEMMAAIKDHGKCGIGCYQNGEQLAAAFVPLVIQDAL